MSENWDLEEFNEEFAGHMRRLDGMIGQLEDWCDTYTINHKKEETRLDDYAALSKNLYEHLEEMKQALVLFKEHENDNEWVTLQEQAIAEKFGNYKPTEAQIKEWMRDIKDLEILLINSPILNKNKSHIEYLLSL